MRVAPGEVRLRGRFLGGSQARLQSLDLIAPSLSCVDGPLGEQLRIEPRRLVWLGAELRTLTPISIEATMTEILSALNDLQIAFQARAIAAWQVQLPGGLGLDIREGATVRLHGATHGDAAQMRLAGPVEVRCEEVSVQLGGGQLRALSRLANVRLTGAVV